MLSFTLDYLEGALSGYVIGAVVTAVAMGLVMHMTRGKRQMRADREKKIWEIVGDFITDGLLNASCKDLSEEGYLSNEEVNYVTNRIGHVLRIAGLRTNKNNTLIKQQIKHRLQEYRRKTLVLPPEIAATAPKERNLSSAVDAKPSMLELVKQQLLAKAA